RSAATTCAWWATPPSAAISRSDPSAQRRSFALMAPTRHHGSRHETQGAERMTSTTTTDSSITIRLATEDDTLALRRLAQLDGTRLPEGELLLAEVEGEIRAALRVPDS